MVHIIVVTCFRGSFLSWQGHLALDFSSPFPSLALLGPIKRFALYFLDRRATQSLFGVAAQSHYDRFLHVSRRTPFRGLSNHGRLCAFGVYR